MERTNVLRYFECFDKIPCSGEKIEKSEFERESKRHDNSAAKIKQAERIWKSKEKKNK